MDKEIEEKLVQDFPSIFRDWHGNPQKTCMAWGLDVGTGWAPLIRKLCEDIMATNPPKDFKIPNYFEKIKYLFSLNGFEAISWIPLIGYDADTYGAIIGPLLFAKYKNIPEKMIYNLEIHDFVKRYDL